MTSATASKPLKMFDGLPQQCRYGPKCHTIETCNFKHYDVCFYFMSARRDHECSYRQCTSEHPILLTRREIDNYVNGLFEMKDGTQFYMCEYINKNVPLKSTTSYKRRRTDSPHAAASAHENPVSMHVHTDNNHMPPISDVVALHTTSHILVSIIADFDSQIAQLQMQIDFINRQKERILSMQL